MRKLLFMCLASIGMTLFAQDFSARLYEAIEKSDFGRADSILSLWEASSPKDAELYPARFNRYINEARQSYIMIGADTVPEGLALILQDKDGNLAGSLQEQVIWDDSLVRVAMEVIDRGIKAHPDRLDFRFGKAAASSFINDWGGVSATAVDVLERGHKNRCKWLWVDNEVIPDSVRVGVMLDGIHDYERMLIENSNPHPLLNANLKYYPADAIALNLKGVMANSSGDMPKAIEYMEQAHAAAPEDALITCNLAYMLNSIGNRERALALYNSLANDEAVDEEWRKVARDMIAEITGR